MNVSLTPQLENFVKQKVLSGKYNSTSEVMREALRLLQEQDELKGLKLQALRKDLQIGVSELDQGESVPLDIEKIKSKERAQ
jgi:antitoxin ParD1/3/4